MSLNFQATRFQCTWPWDILVMLCDGRIVPRHLDLRPFILSGDQPYVTQGGLTRVAPGLVTGWVHDPALPVTPGVAALAEHAPLVAAADRALYRAKFDLADQIIGNRYGYRRPAGGFFLWLDVSQHGGSEGGQWRESHGWMFLDLRTASVPAGPALIQAKGEISQCTAALSA